MVDTSWLVGRAEALVFVCKDRPITAPTTQQSALLCSPVDIAVTPEGCLVGFLRTARNACASTPSSYGLTGAIGLRSSRLDGWCEFNKAPTTREGGALQTQVALAAAAGALLMVSYVTREAVH